MSQGTQIGALYQFRGVGWGGVSRERGHMYDIPMADSC